MATVGQKPFPDYTHSEPVNLGQSIADLQASLADNAKQSDVEKIMSQADFVKIIKNLTSHSSMVFRRNALNDYSIFMHNGVKHVSYNLMKDANDDFLKIGACYVGSITQSVYDKQLATKVGTWVQSSTEIWYTTTVNDTFTANVKGSSLTFRAYKDNRGGIWSIVVDNDPTKTYTISTYSATAGQVDVPLVSGLDPTKVHSIVATFKGADPLNAPSGGTARGWIFYPSSTATGTIVGYVEYNNNNSNLLITNSNKEMAFSITVNGNTQWVPDHGVGTAFNSSSPVFKIDGVVTDPTTMTDGQVIPCKDVKLIQDIAARLPSVSGDVANIKITYHFDLNGIANISGKWKTLQAASIGAGYPIMLPADPAYLNEGLTSFGNSKVNAADDSDYYFTEEKDNCYSYAIVNSARPTLIAAASIDYPLKTIRKGLTGKDTTKAVRYWQRATTPKFYFTNYNISSLMVGETFSWSGRIAVADIDNIYDYVKG